MRVKKEALRSRRHTESIGVGLSKKRCGKTDQVWVQAPSGRVATVILHNLKFISLSPLFAVLKVLYLEAKLCKLKRTNLNLWNLSRTMHVCIL